LQDLIAMRSDKLRQHFHALSRTDLQEQHYNDDEDEDAAANELPTIVVSGIASYEINKVGPFLQRAFSDYGFLTKRSVDGDRSAGKKTGGAEATDTGDSSTADDDKMSQESRKVSMARSRLRRFRS